MSGGFWLNQPPNRTESSRESVVLQLVSNIVCSVQFYSNWRLVARSQSHPTMTTFGDGVDIQNQLNWYVCRISIRG